MASRPKPGCASVIPSALGFTPFEKAKLPLSAEVVAVPEFAVDGYSDLMIAGRYVSGEDALHAAFLQRFEFLETVDMVRCQLTVDRDFYGVQPEIVTPVERHKQGHLRVRRKQQTFLKMIEFCGDVQDIGLDLLNLAVEAAHLGTREILRTDRRGDTECEYCKYCLIRSLTHRKFLF